MINPNSKLLFFFNSSDKSNEAFDFLRDNFNLTLTTNDYIYVGYSKTINSLYFHLATPNVNSNSLTVEFWNGSSWEAVSNLNDFTKGLIRSGYMTWTRPTTHSLDTINSKEGYFYRISTNTNHSAAVYSGCGIIFNDDHDLEVENPDILDENHLAGKTSHVALSVAAKNQIIQDLNNKGLTKTLNNIESGINCWDLLDITQVKEASVFLTLAKIYFNFSDNPDDKYYQNYQDYMKRYEQSMNVVRLYIDKNNDGQEDLDEISPEGSKMNFSVTTLVR